MSHLIRGCVVALPDQIDPIKEAAGQNKHKTNRRLRSAQMHRHTDTVLAAKGGWEVWEEGAVSWTATRGSALRSRARWEAARPSESHQQRQQQRGPSGLVNGAAVVELTQEGEEGEGVEVEGEACARALARSLACVWARERAGPRCSLTFTARLPSCPNAS